MSCVAVYSDKGPARAANQDSCCALLAKSAGGPVALLVVCDGVGGLAHGDVASAEVVQSFVSWFANGLPQLMRLATSESLLAELERAWRTLLDELNASLREYGTRRGFQLGTTFTGLLAHGSTYLVGHVGDCRAYAIGGGHITRLTQDQTLVSHLLAQGTLGPQEARLSPLRNVILQAVGTSESLEPVFVSGTLRAGDLVLLCSDGAYKTIGDEGLLRALSQESGVRLSLDDSCRGVVREARKAGEKDDATVACLKWNRNPKPARGVPSEESAVASAAREGTDTVVLLEGRQP